MLTDTVYKRSENFCLNPGDEREWGRRRGSMAGGGGVPGEIGEGNAAKAKRKVTPEFNPCPCPSVSQKDFGLFPLPCREVGELALRF